MTQEEIITLLEKKGNLTEKEMAKILNLSLVAVYKAVRSMLGSAEINRRRLTKAEIKKFRNKGTDRQYIYFLKNA